MEGFLFWNGNVLRGMILAQALWLFACQTTPPPPKVPAEPLSHVALPSERITILNRKSGHEFFLDEPTIRYWTLSPQDVQHLSMFTYAYLLSQTHHPSKDALMKSQKEFASFRVQFVGIIRGGKKLIFCNYFYDPNPDPQNYDWQLVPVLPSGEKRVFQHCYDVGAGKCLDLHFYGSWHVP